MTQLALLRGVILISAVLSVLLPTLQLADAHGFMIEPKVVFSPSTQDITAYSATIDGVKALPPVSGLTYLSSPAANAHAFEETFKNSTYTSIRDFVMQHQTLMTEHGVAEDCGFTMTEGVPPQQLPENEVVWQHGPAEGFTPSHEGPCEVWCDDERVFHDFNCAAKYPQVPARLPFNRSTCTNKKRLQMVWLALHEGYRWQVYLNCAPLEPENPVIDSTPQETDDELTLDCADDSTPYDASANGQGDQTDCGLELTTQRYVE